MDTCGTMHGWKHSTNTMCWIDRLNIVNSHRTNKVNSGKQGLAKKEICGWQNTNLTTLTRWHTYTGAKFTLTAAASKGATDLQITCLSLVGTLRARSNTSDWEGLCKCLGAKFPGQKRAALGKGLLLALVRDLNGRALTLLEKDLDAVVHNSEEETEETG